jgi:non-heme chloroperoxidase
MTVSRAAIIHGSARTADGVAVHFVESGNPAGPPILFVHGISQSWQSWEKQLNDPWMLERFRMVALDLRGHGASQGAWGAFDTVCYNDGTPGGTARLWANDIAAVISACRLSDLTLVGWSYGGAVVLDYLSVNEGMGAAARVVLVATTPVLQPPGTPEVGADRIFTPEAVAALMRTTPGSADVEYGLRTFIEACLADDTGRSPATGSEVTAITEFNLLVEPSVRLSVMTRAFDYRGFLATLPRSAQEQITVVTPMGDRILQSVHTRTLWPTGGGVVHLPIDREGHLFFSRSPDGLRPILDPSIRAIWH